MQIILLTHSREVSKKTNTGQLVQQSIPQTLTIIWQRTHPDKKLLRLIESGNTALVYPSEEKDNSVAHYEFENFILIDSTWQEARKIYNRSPYLQKLPKIELLSDSQSKYTLRRNQLVGGLCTAECAIELLLAKGKTDLAMELDLSFKNFIL
ncbi:MAG: DTW domain-containing protein [Gammaproteobacteria bacterium]|nr:DTW domain-containing protein [Gammaproteobacteria bacterium]